MSDGPLTRERILEAAEDVLRRFGPGKATVVDVARGLGVSHGTVYRHFPSKAALRSAVTARWLARISAPLDALADDPEPAPARLRRWLRALIDAKRSRAAEDPELFATYMELVAEASDAIEAHVAELSAQLARIVADGVARGELVAADPAVAGRAILDATGRFHNPAHQAEWADPEIDDAFDAVFALLLAGLTPRVANPSAPDAPAAVKSGGNKKNKKSKTRATRSA